MDLEDKEKRSPILWAAFYGRLEMMKQLIERDANLKIINSKSETVESLAKQNKHSHITEYLSNMPDEKTNNFKQ